MARNKLEKMGLLKLVAVVLVAGSIVFTFTACGKTEAPVESPVAIEQTTDIAVEDNDVADVDLIEDYNDIGAGTESEVAETYKVEFEYCQNEDIEAKVDEKVTIPEYKETVLMQTYFSEENYTIADENEYAELFETVSEEENADGSTTIIAKGISEEATYGMVTRYSYDGENMKAVFAYKPYLGENEEISPEDFGLNFVIEKDVDGKYKIVGLQDLAGNRADDIILYYGDVIGWSLTEKAEMVDFEFEDEIYLSQDLVLYPVVANAVDLNLGEETIATVMKDSEGIWIKSLAGTIVRYDTTKQGGKKESGWVSNGGKITKEDGSKEYNPETGTVEETKPSGDTPSTGKKPGNSSGNGDKGGNTTPDGGKTGGNTTPSTPSTPPSSGGDTSECESLPDVGANFSSGDYSDVPRF